MTHRRFWRWTERMSVRERGVKKIHVFSLRVATCRWSGPGCPRIRERGFWVWKIPTPCRRAGKMPLREVSVFSMWTHLCVKPWCRYRCSTVNAGLALLNLLLSRLAFGPGNWLIPKLYLMAPVYLLPFGLRGDLATGELSRWSWCKIDCREVCWQGDCASSWAGELGKEWADLSPGSHGAFCAVFERSFIKAKIPG